jgi:hypothetical protein
MSKPLGVELPQPNKRRRTENENEMQELQNRILVAVANAPKPPAKITRTEAVDPEIITALTKWAQYYGYVLHYKEKRKHFDDVPFDVKHEGREANVYTIEVYWVNIE